MAYPVVIGLLVLCLLVYVGYQNFFSVLEISENDEPTSSYKYPFANEDGNQMYFESRTGDYEPEAVGWRLIEKHIAVDVVGTNKGGGLAMLEAGCGTGRLMRRYCRHFSSCVCIEPDAARMKMAHSSLSTGTEIMSHAEFHNVAAENFETQHRFNLILSSQVIQHLSQANAMEMLKHLLGLLKPDGVMVIVTTNFPPGRESYGRLCERADSACGPRHKYLTKAEYEEVTKSPVEGELPVHYWTDESLRKFVIKSGCSVILHQESFTYWDRQHTHEDMAENGPLSMKEFLANPIHQAIVCKKPM